MSTGRLAEPFDYRFGALEHRKLSLDVPQSRQVVLARLPSQRRLRFLQFRM
jgi:UDP-galactopyranose mutase